jgi:hypothetical protein
VSLRRRIIMSVLGTMLVPMLFSLLGCPCARSFKGKMLPILEHNRRVECSLPLTGTCRDSIISFIDAGGSFEETGGISPDLPNTADTAFLALLGRDSSIYRIGTFERSGTFSAFFDPRKYVEDIVNSCDSEPPPERTRRAYLYRDFWYVFIVDSAWDAQTGETILDANRRFSRMIVMPFLEKKGEK